MEPSSSLFSLMIVVAAAFLIPIVLHRLRVKIIPVVVAEILVGLVIGKSGLNLISEDPWLELLSLFGLIYLMFLSGLEIDFASFRFRRHGSDRALPSDKLGESVQVGAAGKVAEAHPLKVASAIFAFIFVLSFVLAMILMAFGFASDPYLLTLIIATISLGVVVPVLKENRMLETPLGQIILLIAVISDLVTMVLLTVYISTFSRSPGQMGMLLLFFVLVVVIYFVLKRYSQDKLFNVLRRGSVQIGTRAVFAIILLFVVLSETLNVETILGAFLAGVVVSLLAPNKEFKHELDSFGYGFLIPIFFVMIGVNLDLRALVSDLSMVLFIPVLLAALFISKIVPSLLLKKWYSWPESVGAGLLLSSTMSLVVAAATVALEIGIISDTMHGALIMTAVLSCILSPVLFNRVFPFRPPSKPVVAIVGANHITLPVSHELSQEGYRVKLFSTDSHSKEMDKGNGERIPVINVDVTDEQKMNEAGLFKADVIVFGTMDDELNVRLAEYARAVGVKRIIVRAEDPKWQEKVSSDETFALMSTLYASRILLRLMIDSPIAVKMIAHQDDSIREIHVQNRYYHNMLLRDLALPQNVLVLRIFRGDTFITPHGLTQIKYGDRLLVSGPAESIGAIQEQMEQS